MKSPTVSRPARPLTPTAYLLMITFRAWLIEVPLAAVNAFVLMDRVYAPRVGPLTAHQIGMSTRIVIALVLAYVIAYFAKDYTPGSLLLAGAFWMMLWLAFEWGGSLLIGRPVKEILVGWQLEDGYMWPYVLLAYLLAPLLVGTALHPSRRPRRDPTRRVELREGDGPSTRSISDLARSDAEGRDRFLDLLRASSIVAVVVGHWMVTDLFWSGSDIQLRSALGQAPGLWPLTWLFQVIPLFFFVGGYANRRSWIGVQDRGEGYAAFVDRRMHRLLAPTAVLLLAVIVGNMIQALVDAPGLGAGGEILLQPVWFLGIYVMVMALTPFTLRWHARWGWRVVLVALALIGVVEVLRMAAGLTWVAYVNVLLVWGLVHQLGYLYADQALDRRAATWLASVGGLALVVLTAGPYPARMVGVPGDELVNMNPPTAALTALAVTQVGVAVLLRDPLNRWLRRPRVWTAVIACNLSIMSIFLWHQPVMAVVARVLAPTGLAHPDPPGLAWWAVRLVWFAAAGLLLTLVVLLVGRFERGTPPPPAPRRRAAAVAAVTAVVLAELGLLGVAGTDAGRPLAVHRVLGVFDVAPVVGVVCIGVALLLLSGARRDARPAIHALLIGAAAFLVVGAGYAVGLAGLASSPRLLALVGLMALGLVGAAVAASRSHDEVPARGVGATRRVARHP